MSLSTSHECEDSEFSISDYSKHAAHLSDIDLTCYESFYDSSPSEVGNGDIKDLYYESGLQRLEMFERNETNVGYCSRVPDVDYMWPNGDDGVHDVLRLYNAVKEELFSAFSPDDITACLLSGGHSRAAQTSLLDLQQVPISVDAADSVQPCLSSCSPEKTGSQTQLDRERSVTASSSSPARSTESDSQDDARVPSSCVSDFHPSGWYYVEE